MSKLSKAQLKFLNSLQIKKYRQIHQAFLVEGEKICLESITAQWEILHF
jgi:TrmH family RNA methyltransferase